MDPYDAGLDEDDEEQHARMLARLFGHPGGVTKNAAMAAALRGQEEHQRKGIAAIPQAPTQQTQQTQQQAQPQQSVQQSMLPQSLQQAGNPYAGRAAGLEAQRPQAQAALAAATRLPDTGAVEAFGRKRGEAASRHMLTALAAQEAGDEFKPFTQHYLQQATEAGKPLKQTAGTLTAEGYLPDVGYQQTIEVKAAEAAIKQLDTALENTLTLEQRERLEREKLKQAKVIADARIAQSAANAKLIHGGGGQGKMLTPKVITDLTEAQHKAGDIARLALEFKPEYAGVKGAAMEVAGRLPFVGTDAGEWWKNYRKEAELIERHGLFGAALTPTELASWRAANISPTMDAAAVQRNLTRRAEVMQRKYNDIVRNLGADYDVSAFPQMQPLPGKAQGGATGSWDAAAPKPPAAGDVVDGYRFKGGNPADRKNWSK